MIRSYTGNLAAVDPSAPDDWSVRIEVLSEAIGYITYAAYGIDEQGEEYQLNQNTLAFPDKFSELIELGLLTEVTE